jgi:thiol-disulfide isomerase/thioredoxin
MRSFKIQCDPYLKKIFLISTLVTMCAFSHGQMIYRNQANPQLKAIADQLVAIHDYQADGRITFSLPSGGTLTSASSITVKEAPSDTLCGFWYHFKTHEEYRKMDGDFFALFGSAFYMSKNEIVTKTKLSDKPDEFRMKKIADGFIPANYRRSLFFEVTPVQIGKFIQDALSRNATVTVQRPDTVISGTSCSKFIIQDRIYNSPRKTELCFDKKAAFIVYYRQDLNEGVHAQYKIVKFSNSRLNAGLPADFFTETNICGKASGSGSKMPGKGQSLKVGEVVPDWELPVLRTGKMLSSKELRGKYILLEFTGTWCPHCRDAVTMMNKMEDEFKGNKNLSILSVFSTGIDNEERITNFAVEQKIKSTILHSAQAVGDKYFVTGYPSFFIINPAGRLELEFSGFSQDVEDDIVTYFRKVLKRNPDDQ